MKPASKKGLEGTIVFKNFVIGKKLGTGAFGEIFLATSILNPDDKYAIKAQPVSTRHPQLLFEAKLYKYLAQDGEIEGFPKVYNIGAQGGFNLMMMDLLGKSLEDIFVQCDKKFSVKTVVMIGVQLLERIRYMHERHFLHRDLKPDNLLMGIGTKCTMLYLVDMGLAKKFIKEGKHIPYKEGKQLTGTARYASIATHQGIQQSRRDDIQSMGYVLLYFLRGILPWQNMRAKDTKQKYALIMNKKMSTPIQVLCKDFPQQFGKIIQYAKNLKFEDQPDYTYIKHLLSNIWTKGGYERDNMYDWMLKGK